MLQTQRYLVYWALSNISANNVLGNKGLKDTNTNLLVQDQWISIPLHQVPLTGTYSIVKINLQSSYRIYSDILFIYKALNRVITLEF